MCLEQPIQHMVDVVRFESTSAPGFDPAPTPGFDPTPTPCSEPTPTPCSEPSCWWPKDQGRVIQLVLVECLWAEPLEERRHRGKHQGHAEARHTGHAGVRRPWRNSGQSRRLLPSLAVCRGPRCLGQARRLCDRSIRVAGSSSHWLLGPSLCDLDQVEALVQRPKLLALQHALVCPRLRCR